MVASLFVFVVFILWGGGKLPKETYLFYDLETTGLNKAFDQVVQFAAIRTDSRLNKIDQHSFLVKLRPDVIPSPMASITHRIKIAEGNSADCEYSAVKKIHELINEPGTISLGYNTLGFDDEFLRFSFYRNLLTPYTHQFSKGCRRMDILPMAVMYRLFKPDCLSWPEVDGVASMKLENINSLNSLFEGRAHDAMVDVEVTLELARVFFSDVKMWAYLDGYFSKKTDLRRMAGFPVSFQSAAGLHRLGIAVGIKMGSKLNYQAPVLGIGNSDSYSNQTLWLRLDLPQLKDVVPETVGDAWVVRKRAGDLPILIPPEERFVKGLAEDVWSIAMENIRWLMGNMAIFMEIVRYHQAFKYADVPEQDTDAALYKTGFMSRGDLALCGKFHREDSAGKLRLSGLFVEENTSTLASRLLCRNFPDLISNAQPSGYLGYMESVLTEQDDRRLVDHRREKRTTPLSALKEIGAVRDSDRKLDREQLDLLDELEDYLKTMSV